MSANQDLGPRIRSWLHERLAERPDPYPILDEVLSQLPTTPQRRHRWWPLGRGARPPVRATSGATPSGQLTTFSGFRFVVAVAIVALFGGVLLTGVLITPRGDEMTPAAVTVSPSPMTTEELLSGMVTEEVEPGVFRVLHDGVRDLAASLTLLMARESPGIVAGDDGSLWVQGSSTASTEPPLISPAFQLGGDVVELPPGTEGPDFVTSDGRVWAGLHTYDGKGWTEQARPPTDSEWDDPYVVDGAVWAAWPDPLLEDADGHEVIASERRWTVARLDGDEWRPLDEPLTLSGDAVVDLVATDDGSLWAWTEVGLSRWDDSEWTQVHDWNDFEGGTPVAVGPDGTIWLHYWAEWPDYVLRAFDGREWREWSADEVQAKGYWWLFVDVAPDGGLWAVEQQGWMPLEPGEDPECRGVIRFDGGRLDRFLADACADSFEVGPDGSVWTLARTGPDADPRWDLYVITPEAVVAAA